MEMGVFKSTSKCATAKPRSTKELEGIIRRRRAPSLACTLHNEKACEEVPVAVARQLHQHHPGCLEKARSRLKKTSLDACMRHRGVMLILTEVMLSHHLLLPIWRFFLTHDHVLTLRAMLQMSGTMDGFCETGV